MRMRRRPRRYRAGRRWLAAFAMLLWLGMTLSGAPPSGETASPDPGDPCFDSLAAVHQPTAKLTKDVIARFLRAVHSSDCQNNLEFEEWSTETIYDLMQDAPEPFFGALMRSPEPVQASVVKALDGPVDLFVDYSAIYESISTGVRDKRLREYALGIFTPHYQRHLKEQREWERLNGPQGKARQG